jgi:hypothetical protein
MNSTVYDMLADHVSLRSGSEGKERRDRSGWAVLSLPLAPLRRLMICITCTKARPFSKETPEW